MQIIAMISTFDRVQSAIFGYSDTYADQFLRTQTLFFRRIPMIEGWQYPFERPSAAFTLENGQVRAHHAQDLEGRCPVLAIGSNAAPRQLRRKFGEHETVPVTPFELRGWAVVFSAHVSSYGAVPATMRCHPGAICLVALTWLSEAQVEIMDRSEGLGRNYHHLEIVQDGRRLLGYTSAAGPLDGGQGAIRLAEVASMGGPPARLLQTAMLRKIAGWIGSDDDGMALSKRIASDPAYRDEINALLASKSEENTP